MNLFVISNNPNRASFRQRIGMYLPVLVNAGINSEVAKLPKGFFNRKTLFKKAGSFDIVFLHKKCLNFFDAKILTRYAKKIIYDFDDAMMYSPKKPQKQSYAHYWPFKRTAALANLVIAGNSYLAQMAKKYNSNVVILPTGLDTEKYKSAGESQKDGKIRLVWIGSKSTLRYLDEIKEPLEQIGGKYKNAVLRIISDEFPDFGNIEVEKIKWTLDGESRDLSQCDIGIAPLPDNNFTKGKCGFKVLQYMAAALPVAASPVGVNSDLVRDGTNGFCATTGQQWFESISRLINDAQLRRTMGQANQIFVKQYDAKIIGRRLCDLISGSA